MCQKHAKRGTLIRFMGILTRLVLPRGFSPSVQIWTKSCFLDIITMSTISSSNLLQHHYYNQCHRTADYAKDMNQLLSHRKSFMPDHALSSIVQSKSALSSSLFTSYWKSRTSSSGFVENWIVNDQSLRILKVLNIRINVVIVMIIAFASFWLNPPYNTTAFDALTKHLFKENANKNFKDLFSYSVALFEHGRWKKYLYISKMVSLNLPNHPLLL